MPISIDKIEDFLKDVNPNECFWINRGPVVRNIFELVSALEHMDEKTFAYHVNKDKDDFSEWIRTVLKENQLADSLLKSYNKNEVIKKIKQRIDWAEKESNNIRRKQIVKEKTLEKIYLEFIISFILGLIVGIVIGIIIEYYALIPRGWF